MNLQEDVPVQEPAVAGAPWSARERLEGARLLVTGATGFLGKVLVAHLLMHAPGVQITLVARGKRRETAQRRVRQAFATSPAYRPLRARHGDGLPAFLDRHVRVVDGDLARPLGGLDDAALEALGGRIDAVVHVAGLTDFDPDPQQALRTNTLGALHAADLAARLGARRLLHVSTAYVAGRRDGEVPEALVSGLAPSGAWFDPTAELEALEALCARLALPSERLREGRARAAALGWPNVYTYSKGLAEHLLARRHDVDVAFARPTIVESALRFPFPGWVEGINTSAPIVWMLSGWLRALPSDGRIHFDVIPVDVAVRGMALQLARHLHGDAPQVMHLGTSDANPLRFDRALDLTGLAARRIHSRDGAAPLARFLLRHLDAVPRPFDEAAYPLPLVRRAARGLRDRLQDADLAELLPPRWYRRFGQELDARRKRLARECRDVERTVARAEEVLRAYRPFTHDHDWVFLAGNARALSASLVPADREDFGFDVEAVDWRRYWLDVHVPGLETWSWPLFDGRKAPLDAPPAWAQAEEARAEEARPADGSGAGGRRPAGAGAVGPREDAAE